jgi:glycosyltransferase involved in cell wall biosynthesis
MKIAMIGSRGIPVVYSGIESSLEQICPRLVSRKHEVTVYCRSRYSTIPSNYQGVNLIKLPSINTKHLDTISHVFITLMNSLVKHFDIIHIHAIGPALLSFLPKLKRTKVVLTIHGLDWQRAKWNKFAKFCLKIGEKSSTWFPDKIIVVSKVLKDYYQKRYGIAPCYIPNGTVIPDIKSPNIMKKWGLKQNNYILFVGRLVPEKGCHYLIQAYNELETNLKLVIAGDSAYDRRYVQSLKEISKSRNIIYTGFISGVLLEELLSNAYLYVLPSEIEGLSISLLEAMSYARCVVTSDIQENLEVINDYGYSFKNKDYKDLKRILKKLLVMPDTVHSFGTKAREYTKQNFSWDIIINQLEEVYLSLVK